MQACEFPPVELLRPDVPSDLIAILNMAMAKDPQTRFADAGRMYEAMLAFLYAHGSRSGANELAEFLARFRTHDEPGATRSHERISISDRFEADSVALMPQLTPVEIPATRSLSSIPRIDLGSHIVAMERAAEMGERREITALAIELPVREPRDDGGVAQRVMTIVNRYGGRVLRQDPEQVVALFGLDEPDGRDTEIATRCALVAVRAVAGPRHASAGLHTSRVHVSSTGEPTDDDRLAGLVATSRDLARVREGRVALSPAAARHVRGVFDFELLGDPETTSIGSGSLVKDVRGPEGAFGRFVGRKEELRKIGEILAASTKRSARLLTLRGDHGVGKTRLLYEVERRLRKGGYNVGLHIAACPPRGRELPLSGIVAMLHVLCGVTEGDTPDRILAVQPRLRALGLSSEEVTTVLAALGASVPAPVGNAKTVLRSAFTRMVASLCEDRPHTFAWDPGDCMDDESFEILRSAFTRLSTTRVVFAFTARAGFTHPLEKVPAHAGLDLTDLSTEDAVRLIGLRLGIDTVPDELARFVRERASGHPQFIEEVLKGLVDARAVTVADKRVVSMKLLGQDLALPKTLRGLVASRVSRLAPEDRTTLQAAAVLGDTVDASVLAHMLGQPIGILEKALGTLKRRDFLVHTGPSELRFTSPIVREVVADALTIEASREMHAAAGHALESVLADHAWEQAARIATHFYESGNRERAADYFARSGERRLEARQLEAAAKDYARALELCDLDTRPPEELAAWLSGLAAAVRLVRTAPEAPQMCDRVVARADAAGSAELQVRVRVYAGRILGALHLFDAARARFSEAEAVADGNEALAKQVLSADAELSARQGDFKRAHAQLARIQQILGASSADRQEEHKILCGLSQAHAALGDRRAAMLALERAEVLLPNDAAAACERQKLWSLVDYFSRDFRAAAVAAERAVDLSRQLGVGYEIMVNLHNLGDILIRMNDYARAYGALQQSLALCDEQGFERLGNLNRSFLAYLDAAAGDANAENLLRQGIRYAEANDFTMDVLGARLLLAQLLMRRDERPAARLEYLTIREIAQEVGNRLITDDCDRALAGIPA